MKKIALLSAAGVAALGMSVCAAGEDWPVVSFPYVPVVEITAEEEVETALNDYLVSIDAGVKADLVKIDFGNLNTTMTLMLSSTDEPIDLYSYNFWSNLSSVVSNEQCIDIGPYLEQYPEMVDAIGEEYLKLGQIDGVQYALPTVSAYSTGWYYVLRRDIAEEIGVADKDETSITLDEMEEIMEKAKEAHPDQFFMPIVFDLVVTQGYDYLSDSDIMGALPGYGAEDTTIINYYDTDDFADLCARAKRYADKGFFLNDPLNQTHDKSFLKNGVCAGSITNGTDFTSIKDDMNASYCVDVVAFQISDVVASCTTASGSGYCISSVSQNPDAAAKMLSLLYTDENVMRFVAQGLEGEHYVMLDDGTSAYPEGKTAVDLGWGTGAQWYFPNQTLCIPFATSNPNYYVDMIAANTVEIQSKAIGFIFDTTNVYNQYTAVDAVVKQYRDALLFGQVDVEEYLELFRSELKDAGIDDVIAEKQAQLDAYLAE